MSTSSDSDQDSNGSTSGDDGQFNQSREAGAAASHADMQQQTTGTATSSAQNQYRTLSNEISMPTNYIPFMMSSPQSSLMMQGGTKGQMPASSAAGSSGSMTPGHRLCYEGQQKQPRDLNGSRYPDHLGGDAVTNQQQQSCPQSSPHIASNVYRETAPHGGSVGSAAPSSMYGFDQALASAPNARFGAEYGFGQHTAKLEEMKSETEHPPPPKKPLTPYMRFNKLMWHEVKAANPSMGVCEVSSAIGRLWRELGPDEKQRHNDDYSLDKLRYDEELKSYLKLTGLKSADLVKPKPKKTSQPVMQRRPVAAPAPVASQQLQQKPQQQQHQHQSHHQSAAGSGSIQHHHQQQQQQMFQTAASQQQQQQQQHQQQQQQHLQHQQLQQQQQLQALMGLPVVTGSLPIGMSVGLQSMGMLSGFPQMWASQQYPASLMSAGQLQELYSGGAPPPAHSQQLPNVADQAAAAVALYRYQQGFM